MAFWNRNKHDDRKDTSAAVDPLTRAVVQMRVELESLRHEVAQLRASAEQPVPTNGASPAGSAVQDWLPVLDRAHEIALVAMGHADLAQSFGAAARQKEYHQAEQRDVDWTDPDEGSTYENI